MLHRDNGSPLITLKSRTDGSYLRLHAGPSEASAILLELKRAALPYPTIHDILASVLFRHRFKGKKLVISALSEEVPAARFEYRRMFRSFTEVLRPADGIALALRIGLPIYLSLEAVRQGEQMIENAGFPRSRSAPGKPYLSIEQARHA